MKPQRGRELETLQVINKQTPPALRPPPLNQEGELEAMATKKLSLFDKREYPAGGRALEK